MARASCTYIPDAVGHRLLRKQRTISATVRHSTAIKTAVLVSAVSGSILEWSPLETMMSVFCSVRTETSESMKLIVRRSRTRQSEDLFLFLRLTDAMVILY